MKSIIQLSAIIFVLSFFCGVASAIECDSCSDCTAKLNGDHSNVTLSQNITGIDGCIDIQASGVEFDCTGHSIRGTNTGAGISIDGQNNVTINNCKIYEFAVGFDLVELEFLLVELGLGGDGFGLELLAFGGGAGELLVDFQ